MRRRHVAAAALSATAALLFTGCGAESGADGVRAGDLSTLSVTRAYVAAPAGSSGPAAMYLSARNGTAAADTLDSVHSDVAGRTELHEQVFAADGRAEMHEVGPLPVAPGATLDLVPGGLHVMLLELRRPLAPGDTVDAELRFRRGGAVAVRVPVVSYVDLARIYESDAGSAAGHDGGS